MAQYRVDDLMINMLPAAGTAAPQQFPCHIGCTFLHTPIGCQFGCTYYYPSICHFGCSLYYHTFGCQQLCSFIQVSFCNLCSFHLPSICHGGCTFVAPSIACPAGTVIDPCGGSILVDPATNLQTLGALKEQLRQALSNVEAQERAFEEASKPQTAADIDALEQRLRQSLEELQARRAELQRREGGPASAS